MLWRLRFGKAAGTAEAKSKLKSELDELVASSKDIKMLDVARQTYSDLLHDQTSAQLSRKKILQIDPTWYPERGHLAYVGRNNMSGAFRLWVN